MFVGGNVYLNGAIPIKSESSPQEISYNPEIQIEERDEGVFLSMILDRNIFKTKTQLVTTELLGKTLISAQAYTNPDDSPLVVDTDYLGNARKKRNPSVGPFENPGTGNRTFRVWGKRK